MMILIQDMSLFANYEHQQALSFLTKKEYAKALFYYEQVVNNSTNSQEIYLEYISCLRLAGMPNDAVKQSFIALEMFENNPHIWLSLANVYIDLHQWDLAISAVKKAKLYNADSSALTQTLHNISYRMIVAGEFKSALIPLNLIFEHSPANSLALINKGLLLYIDGEDDDALELIEQGIKQSEKDSNTQVSEWGYRIQNSIKTDLKALLNSIQFEQYQLLAESLKSIPEKGNAKSIVIPKYIDRYYNIFNQTELELRTQSDLVSMIVLNNESGSVDLRFMPIFGKDNFDVWISQYPGEIGAEDFKAKSELILNNLIRHSEQPDKKFSTYTDDNVTFNYVTVSKNEYEPIKENDFPVTTQGMAKYKNGFVIFSIMTLNEEAVDSKLDIIKSLHINKK